MSGSIPSQSISPLGHEGLDPYVNPPFITAFRPPTTNDVELAGTEWQDNSAVPPVIYQTTGAGVWVLPGNVSISGTTNQISESKSGGAFTLSIPSTFIAPGSIASTTTVTGATGVTATNGNLNAAGTGSGLLLTPTTVAAAASPQTANGRVLSVAFSGVSIAGGASQTFVISNTSITGSSTELIVSMVGATAGAALCIESVTNSASQSSIVVTNGTGATTSTANITFTILVIN